MFRVFDFRCSEGHTTEHFVDDEVRFLTCICGRMADRLIAAPRVKLDGLSGDFPTAADKWANDRESHMRKERKHMANHKEYLNGQPVLD